jgi:hypothetical protein
MSNDAPAKFVAAVKQLAPAALVIPVWTPECEEQDKAALCAGVGCFEGTCWREFTAQLMPLAQEAQTIGALLPYREFQRDLPRYGQPAGWVEHALASFSEMPSKRNGTPIPAGRLVAILQGWKVTPEQIDAQIARTREAGAAGYVVALTEIQQGWEPRIISTNTRAK